LRFGIVAAIDGKRGAPHTPRQLRRCKFAQRPPCHGDDLVFQRARIFLDECGLRIVVKVHGAQVVAHHRPGVRVRTIEHDRVAR
jgi:hypothetical protein